MPDGIIVKIPTPVSAIRIVSEADLIVAYEESGEAMPPTLAFVPYFELDGKGYYAFPHKDEEIEQHWKKLGYA